MPARGLQGPTKCVCATCRYPATAEGVENSTEKRKRYRKVVGGYLRRGGVVTRLSIIDEFISGPMHGTPVVTTAKGSGSVAGKRPLDLGFQACECFCRVCRTHDEWLRKEWRLDCIPVGGWRITTSGVLRYGPPNHGSTVQRLGGEEPAPQSLTDATQERAVAEHGC